MNIKIKNLTAPKKYFLISALTMFLLSLVISIYFIATLLANMNDIFQSAGVKFLPNALILFCAIFVLINFATYAVFTMKFSFYPEKLNKESVFIIIYNISVFFMIILVLANAIDSFHGRDLNFYTNFTIASLIMIGICMTLNIVRFVYCLVGFNATEGIILEQVDDNEQNDYQPLQDGNIPKNSDVLHSKNEESKLSTISDNGGTANGNQHVESYVQSKSSLEKQSTVAEKSTSKKRTTTDSTKSIPQQEIPEGQITSAAANALAEKIAAKKAALAASKVASTSKTKSSTKSTTTTNNTSTVKPKSTTTTKKSSVDK